MLVELSPVDRSTRPHSGCAEPSPYCEVLCYRCADAHSVLRVALCRGLVTLGGDDGCWEYLSRFALLITGRYEETE